MLEIFEYRPSDMREIAHADKTLQDLILHGYDMTEERRSNAGEAVDQEFNYPNRRGTVFLARQDDKAVGVLTLLFWRDAEKDKRGKRFWPKIRELDPEFPTPAEIEGMVACDVAGVVTDPSIRGNGIGKHLYAMATDSHNLGIIVGQTKTPGAVMLRSTLPGYRTFYGDAEVTRTHPQPQTAEHQALMRAYLHAREQVMVSGETTVFEYVGRIAPTVPDVAGYPEIIQGAFAPVIRAQKRYSECTVMSGLISVKSHLLKR